MYNTKMNFKMISKKYSQTQKEIDLLKHKNEGLEAIIAQLQEENSKMKAKSTEWITARQKCGLKLDETK